MVYNFIFKALIGKQPPHISPLLALDLTQLDPVV